ncbi:unnamed protein product [Closterium sp. NIES-53]
MGAHFQLPSRARHAMRSHTTVGLERGSSMPPLRDTVLDGGIVRGVAPSAAALTASASASAIASGSAQACETDLNVGDWVMRAKTEVRQPMGAIVDGTTYSIATVRRHYPPAAMTAVSISAACSDCLLPRRPLCPHAPPRRSAHAKPFPRHGFTPSLPASLLSNPRAVCRPPRADRAAAPRAQSSSHDDLEGRRQRDTCLSRRDALLSLALLPPSLSAATLLSPSPSLAASPAAPDTTVTHRAFLDFAMCPTAVRLDRTLGDDALICADGEPLGRVVLGLYGRAAPDTVAQFVRMVAGDAGSTYKGSVIHRSLPGQYVQAGHQGQVARGDVAPPTLLPSNRDTVAAASFALSHLRPGTLSLCVGENNDDERARSRSNYRNVEFLITTGAREGEGGRGRDKGERGRGEGG